MFELNEADGGYAGFHSYRGGDLYGLNVLSELEGWCLAINLSLLPASREGWKGVVRVV